jgi:hypothetical protein
MTVHYRGRVLPVTAYGSYPVPDPAKDEKTIIVRMEAIVALARGEAMASSAPPA